ncbi:dephospho-CoA kinase [Arthrobacter crusticola]|nr:dephospho-CoA kinase [Arthrobacter crusticola]
MLRVGLTGGIAAGKSLAAGRLRALGAVVIDADALAREVVEPGTEGLAEVLDAFGRQLATPEGALDRRALGDIIFGDSGARERLNAILHPRIRALAEARTEQAPAGAVVVEDLPLLVETGQVARFHLVVVIDAPEDQRIDRMVRLRGMTPEAALSRLRAQLGPDERNSAADVVINNAGSEADTLAHLEALWHDRILPFNANLLAGVPALRGPLDPAEPDPTWPAQAARLSARLRRVDPRVLDVAHIGPTAVPGRRAPDVLEFRLAVSTPADAAALRPLLTAAGFPPAAGGPGAGHPAARGRLGFHSSADPGRAAEVHLELAGPPVAPSGGPDPR